MSSKNPRKWRFTWEAQSHVPTLRLFLFDSITNPSSQCKDLNVDLNLSESLVLVNWSQDSGEFSLRVPIPRVLIDAETPLSFIALEDHILVKLVLLLPVDHPIVSGFESLLNLSEDGENEVSEVSKPLSIDSDIKSLSSGGGVNFYCRSCSTKLTRSPLGHFVEMPSFNWREVADNWFGACCCSFGGISEKLVTKYANSYKCAKGTCLLNSTTFTLFKDDLVGSEFLDRDGKKYALAPVVRGDGELSEATIDSESNQGSSIGYDSSPSEKMHDLNDKLRFMHLKNENLSANLESEVTEKVSTGDYLSCTSAVSEFSGKEASAPGCCVHAASPVANHVDEDCTNDVFESSPKDQDPIQTMGLLENQKSFLNGFLGNAFMARSSNLSADVEWIEYVCPLCSSLIGAYPRSNSYEPVDGGVRLFKCYVSTCLPVGGSGDVFRKYTLERMFTNQILESAEEELSFRTVVKDLKTKSPMLQIVLLNSNSWCCTGYCLGLEDTTGPVLKIDLRPVIKVLFSNCRSSTESESRMIEEWIRKNVADEVFMLTHQIQKLIESLVLAKDILPPSYAFLQGLPLSSMPR